MFWWDRKTEAQSGHSDEWNDGYGEGYNAAWSTLYDSIRDSMEFHNAYVQMLERELQYLRQELKKDRQDDSGNGGDGCNDT